MGAISLEVQQAEILRSLVMVALGMMAMMVDDGSFGDGRTGDDGNDG